MTTLLPGMKKPKDELVAINAIRTDLGTQVRAVKLNQDTVELYAVAMRKRAAFPRILLFRDKAVDGYILVDGLHRLEAHKRVHPDYPVMAEVFNGTLEEARWFSYAMNANHGLKRTNADKNRAVQLALLHPMAVGKSNCEIADHVGVDEKLVRCVRENLETTSALPKSAKRVGRDGRAINTEKIGRTKKQVSDKKAKPIPPNNDPVASNTLSEEPMDTVEVVDSPVPEELHVTVSTCMNLPHDHPEILVYNLISGFPREYTRQCPLLILDALCNKDGLEAVQPLIQAIAEKYGS